MFDIDQISKMLFYSFIIVSYRIVLFSSAILSDTSIIFITASGLSNAQQSFVNDNLYKILGVINSTEIKYLNLVKGESKWTNVNLSHSEYTHKASNFSFHFVAKKFRYLIIFDQNEKTVPVLSFKIEIIKLLKKREIMLKLKQVMTKLKYLL